MLTKIPKKSSFRLEARNLARLRIGNARGEKTFFHPAALDLTETIDTCAHLAVGDPSSIDLLIAGRIDENLFPARGFPDSASEVALERLFVWLDCKQGGRCAQ